MPTAHESPPRWLLESLESTQDCEFEDATRANQLMNQSIEIADWIDGRQIISLLHRIGKVKPSPTLASSRYLRHVRQRLVPAVVSTFEPYPKRQICFFKITRTLAITPEELVLLHPVELKRKFGKHLRQLGISAETGPFVSFLHIEYNSNTGSFTLGYKGVTTAPLGWVFFEPIEARRRSDMAKNDWCTALQPVSSLPDQFIDLFNGVWSTRTDMPWELQEASDISDLLRICGPAAAAYLCWMDRRCLRDLTLLRGVQNSSARKMRSLKKVIDDGSRAAPGWRARVII